MLTPLGKLFLFFFAFAFSSPTANPLYFSSLVFPLIFTHLLGVLPHFWESFRWNESMYAYKYLLISLVFMHKRDDCFSLVWCWNNILAIQFPRLFIYFCECFFFWKYALYQMTSSHDVIWPTYIESIKYSIMRIASQYLWLQKNW